MTRLLAARLQTEEFYRADRFYDAMKHVTAWRGAIDCGAHVGAWSRALAKRFGRVLAVEMNPAAAACLRANLGGCPHAVAVNYALGARAGRVDVGGVKGAIDGEVRAGASVAMAPLDDLLATHPLGAIDYVKVHVNGYELEVLKGARATLARHRPVMTVVIKRALANFGASPAQVFGFMDSLGYGVVSRLKPYYVFRCS